MPIKLFKACRIAWLYEGMKLFADLGIWSAFGWRFPWLWRAMMTHNHLRHHYRNQHFQGSALYWPDYGLWGQWGPGGWFPHYPQAYTGLDLDYFVGLLPVQGLQSSDGSLWIPHLEIWAMACRDLMVSSEVQRNLPLTTRSASQATGVIDDLNQLSLVALTT